MEQWVVHKFGGTSVASPERYRHVASIIGNRPERRRAVVVSAMSGVTDALVRAVTLSTRRDRSYLTLIEELRAKHREAVTELVPAAEAEELLERFDRDFTDLADVLHATWLLRSHSNRAMDLVSGFGELWSAQILAAHMRAAGAEVDWLDAREVLVVSRDSDSPEVDWSSSAKRLHDWMHGRPVTKGRKRKDAR